MSPASLLTSMVTGTGIIGVGEGTITAGQDC